MLPWLPWAHLTASWRTPYQRILLELSAWSSACIVNLSHTLLWMLHLSVT